jgi:hypothetical protein
MLIGGGFVGIFLGLQHQILVLIPVTLGAAITFSIATMLDGQSVSSSLLAAIIPALALQGGYMIGVTGRDPIRQILARFSARLSG